jgi:hypothetical protein
VRQAKLIADPFPGKRSSRNASIEEMSMSVPKASKQIALIFENGCPAISALLPD